MKETVNNNGFSQLWLIDVIVRLLIFALIWIGIYHLYITILNTNWPIFADILSSFTAAFILFYNKGFKNWFLNNK